MRASQDKSAARQALKATRASLDAATRARHSADIVQHLREHVLPAHGRVAIFWPLPFEVDLRALIGLAGTTHFYLPRVSGPGLPLTFHSALAPRVPGRFGVSEPLASSPSVALATLDLALFPALGLTRSGVRLGYGGGFYDRTFAQAPDVTRIGVAFEAQICEQLPQGVHDLAMHAIVTELGHRAASC